MYFFTVFRAVFFFFLRTVARRFAPICKVPPQLTLTCRYYVPDASGDYGWEHGWQSVEHSCKLYLLISATVRRLVYFAFIFLAAVLIVIAVIPAQIQSMVGESSKGRWLGGLVACGAGRV